MFRVLLAVALLTEILCGPLPRPSTEVSQDEEFELVQPSLGPTDVPQELNPSERGSEKGEKLEAQETFYPVGGVWWGVRPWGGWGGWGGYRPWHGPHGGGWGGYRPWHGPHWGGHWGAGR